MEAEVVPEDWLSSMNSVDSLYSEVKFNDETKFWFLLNASMKVSDLASFSIQCCATNYKSLKTEIMDFEDGRRALFSATGSTLVIGTSLKAPTSKNYIKSPTLLVRPNALVSNGENNINTLSQQMA